MKTIAQKIEKLGDRGLATKLGRLAPRKKRRRAAVVPRAETVEDLVDAFVAEIEALIDNLTREILRTAAS